MATLAETTPNAQPHLPYTKDDFVSGADVRWCPGCGDYSILSVMQRTLAQFDIPKEKQIFISGIGCSSRFPYYMNTYGFHTIHGRAPSIATGLKIVRPDLTVWVITGDGDGLSIGGNHLIHAMRRNIDLKIILINNQIYGLTKGQYSPTSEKGKVTKSSPFGSIDYPINPLCVAIASEATFIARTFDQDPRHMGQVLARAAQHKGVAFVEIYQNCVIFNKDTFVPVIGRETREDRTIYLENGKPLTFGKAKDKAIRIKGLQTEVVNLADVKDPSELLIHNESDTSSNYAYLLTQMEHPEMPVPFGVLRAIEKPSYEKMLDDQVQFTISKKGKGNLKDIIYTEDIWHVEGQSKTEKKKAAPLTNLHPADAKTEKCPYCGHLNITGMDRCEKCRHSLTFKDIPEPGKDKLQKLVMTETVSDFISKIPPIIVSEETSLQEVLEKMQANPTKGCVLICDPKSKKLIGIASIRDILLKVAGIVTDLSKTPVKNIMTKNPECLQKDAPLSFALHKMHIGRFRHVPVIDNGVPVGVVSTRDLIEYLSSDNLKNKKK